MERAEENMTVVCFGHILGGKSSFINEASGYALAVVGNRTQIQKPRAVVTY